MVAESSVYAAKTFAEWQSAYHNALLAGFAARNAELAYAAALNSEQGWWVPGAVALEHKPGSLECKVAELLQTHAESDT